MIRRSLHCRSFFLSTLCAAALGAAGAPAASAQTHGENLASQRLDALRGDTTHLLDFLRAMPKGGDLHTHLGGAINPVSWMRWAAEDGLCIDVSTLTLSRPPCSGRDRVPAAQLATDDALRNAAIDAWSMRGWKRGSESGADHFFATFAKTAVVGDVHLGEMLAEITSRAAAQHVEYIELMMNVDAGAIGRLGVRAGWNGDFAQSRDRIEAAGLRDTLRVASRAVDRGERREREILKCDTPAADAGCNVTVRYIYQGIRNRPPAQVFAQILAGFEWPAVDHRFVSLNLVAPEHDAGSLGNFDIEMRMIGFVRAAHPDVPITLHAGELSEQVTSRDNLRSHIRESVEIGHANRIGHGVDVLQEIDAESLLREMAARHILVETALTSNDVILGVRGAAHPLAAYLAHGVPVALVTDDEGVSQSDITHEYFRAATDQHLGYLTLKSLARNSITYSFADRATKARLQRDLETAFTRFEEGLAAATSPSSRVDPRPDAARAPSWRPVRRE